MKLALPKRIGSTVAASRRFRPRHPLYRKYRPRIDDFCHLAISEYNLGMDQDMKYKRFIWIYVVSVAPLFYITLLASDKRTGEKHYCQAQVIPRDDPPGARPFFPSFVRLPPTDHEDATTLDAHRISTIMIRGLWRSNVAWWRSNVAADPVEAAVQSILAALSYFLLTTDTLLFFQCCTSARFHRKPDTLYFYITFTAKAMGEIDAFYCDTKVRRRGSTYKVLSFSRRSEEGIYRKDKPYVDLKNKKSLSLINQCANAAVGLYNYKTGARMVSPRVVMAYHSLSLGENAYHIRFKASWGTSRPASICSATVIYDDEVKETQKFVFPIEKGEKTLGYVVVESFIIWPGAWQESDLRTKTSETKKQISWGAP
ncbi:hypothetical protein Tsubulata_048305 [Turnera subulata]|uniref:Uncharacterized protein n=1 Tax=Turnera subulata TaxID=218843 RepID=A0A9Q0FC23_9ROSI|nr:hypothetical protein Tsubulata_048305 [Turnera subulata]